MSAFEPYEGTEPYIFVSYARKDKDRVLPAVEALANAGYRVWYDDAVEWTEDWRDQIAGRVQTCTVFLAFLSEASLRSKHCDAEIKFALSNDRTILSVYLTEDIQKQLSPGLKMYLNTTQAVKLYEYDGIAAFVERLRREKVFAPCKAEPEWNRIGQIQWKLDPSSGLLTIAKNEDWNRPFYASIPPYQGDPSHDGSTAPWMLYREQIRAVEIRDDIHMIGDHAFKDCPKLTSVTILDSVTSIGVGTFAGCVCLISVTIPDSVTSIGDGAFEGCTGLTSVTIPDRVTTIGIWVFAACADLTSVTIGDSVTSIGDSAFYGCNGLTSVTIPNSVTSIGELAFFGCEGLTSVTIPDSVTSIGDYAFLDCTGLTSVTIPDSVTSIGGGAFDGCAGLTSVTIPAGARFTESGGLASFPEHTQIIRRPPREDGP